MASFADVGHKVPRKMSNSAARVPRQDGLSLPYRLDSWPQKLEMPLCIQEGRESLIPTCRRPLGLLPIRLVFATNQMTRASGRKAEGRAISERATALRAGQGEAGSPQALQSNSILLMEAVPGGRRATLSEGSTAD